MNPLHEQHAPDDERYTVANRMDVIAILRALQSRRALVAAYLDAAEDFMLTSVIAVHAERDEVLVACCAISELNERAAAERRMTCIAAQDGIKVRFMLDGVERVLFQAGDAFRASIPATLQRVQRRDYYRVALPPSMPLMCVVPLAPRGDGASAELIVLDLSAGGIGVMDHHHLLDLEPGDIHRRRRMELPGAGVVTFDMQVKTTFEIRLPDGMSCMRSGCEFLDLPPLVESVIQRFILQIERERNARQRESA
jgi:flagellar brake protein